MNLPITTKSFYDIPKVNPKGSDTEPEGPVKDIPARVHTTPSDMTFIKEMIPAKLPTKPAPENNNHFWNAGGNENWFSVFEKNNTNLYDVEENHFTGKTPINGKRNA